MSVMVELMLIIEVVDPAVEVFGGRHRHTAVSGRNSDYRERLHCSGFWLGDSAGRLEIPGLARPGRGRDGYGDEESHLKGVRGLHTYLST